MTNSTGHGGSALHTSTALELRKRAARQAGMAARATARPSLGNELAAHVLASGLIPAGATVAGYWPLRSEIDIRPLLSLLHARGHRLALPRTPPRGNPLAFHGWAPGDPLSPGPMGTWQPSGELVEPDVLLIPLLAFDDTGARLGYGGGYYDRTLARLPHALTIGCAYASQRMAAVPMGPHDIRLQAVATEHGVLHPIKA